MNIPNSLTLMRIILVPFFVLAYYLPFPWSVYASTIIFTVASLTDWLDGYLARALNQSTPLGAFLDPIADKLMVCIALLLIASTQHTLFLTIPIVLIIGRELIISGLREWMAKLGANDSVAVSNLGKYKTTAQMVSIIALLLASFSNYFFAIGIVCLYFSVVLTLWSMISYFKKAWPHITSNRSLGIPTEA